MQCSSQNEKQLPEDMAKALLDYLRAKHETQGEFTSETPSLFVRSMFTRVQNYFLQNFSQQALEDILDEIEAQDGNGNTLYSYWDIWETWMDEQLTAITLNNGTYQLHADDYNF